MDSFLFILSGLCSLEIFGNCLRVVVGGRVTVEAQHVLALWLWNITFEEFYDLLVVAAIFKLLLVLRVLFRNLLQINKIAGILALNHF